MSWAGGQGNALGHSSAALPRASAGVRLQHSRPDCSGCGDGRGQPRSSTGEPLPVKEASCVPARKCLTFEKGKKVLDMTGVWRRVHEP